MNPKLTRYSAWWGESFVTELRRISETSDRKVHFANVTVAGADDAAKTAAETSSELPIRQEISNKDNESDPAAAVEAQKESAGSALTQ
jgi:trehalose 6-phosphate synthase